jgi:arylsulfatase A
MKTLRPYFGTLGVVLRWVAYALVMGMVMGLGLERLRAADGAASRMNVIVILVDDLGWTDLGCFGSRYYQTPNVDRLAEEGMRFTQAYSACTVCSPTRASILTGQYPARLHLTDWIEGHKRPYAKLRIPDWTMHLRTDVPNIAKALKSVGYATASVGKWHLGEEAYGPEKQGFDVNVAGNHRGQPPSYFSPYRMENLQDGPEGEFLSDRLTTEVIGFIEKNRERPFFVYFPHYAVHTPLMAKAEAVERYRGKTDPRGVHKDPKYAGLIESVDESVGRLMAKLKELRLSEKTLVIFTSDNGGLMGVTRNDPLRVGKGSAYEGGVRVPLIVRWPGVTRAGSVAETPVFTADYVPTILEATGARWEKKAVLDGVSLKPVLSGGGRLKRDAIYWHYPHYHPGGATPYGAVREGDFRLVEFYEDGRVELYNVREDVGEQRNLAKENPAKAEELLTKLRMWRREVGAQMPTPNPDYDPEKDKAQAMRKKGGKSEQ